MVGLSRQAWIELVAVAGVVTGCTTHSPRAEPPGSWVFEPGMFFPADGSLNRPEDGVALPDGRLIVSDQVHGLRIVASDGSSQPFGNLPGCGYLHNPPARSAAANGVKLEPSGTHLVVSDVVGGGIYRVALADGATELAHQHRFGVNTACRDSSGALWFTQSTETTAELGEARMFAAIDMQVADGALWRLPFRDGRFALQAELVADGLRYANGLELDERSGVLYLAETLGDRVLKARLHVKEGRIGEFETLAELPTPDNLELDGDGWLWVAMPVRNEVRVINPATGTSHSVFHLQTPAQTEMSAEFVRRGEQGLPRLELLNPELWQPLPGLVTGTILGAADGSVYVTGLGNAMVRLGTR